MLKDHPLQEIRRMTGKVLREPGQEFETLYASGRKPAEQEQAGWTEEHIPADNTLLEAWAGRRNFREEQDPPDRRTGGCSRKLLCDTQESKTDLEARSCKGSAAAAVESKPVCADRESRTCRDQYNRDMGTHPYKKPHARRHSLELTNLSAAVKSFKKRMGGV